MRAYLQTLAQATRGDALRAATAYRHRYRTSLRVRLSGFFTDLAYRIRHLIDAVPAKIAARRDGWDPDYVVPCGPSLRAVGDFLTDGPEYPAWYFYSKHHQEIFDLQPLGPVSPSFIG